MVAVAARPTEQRAEASAASQQAAAATSIQHAPGPTVPVTNPVGDGRRSYENSAYRFALLYPDDLIVNEYEETDSAMSATFRNETTGQAFHVYVTPHEQAETTPECIALDLPSGVMDKVSDILVDGVHGTAFFSTNPAMGQAREIWLINDFSAYNAPMRTFAVALIGGIVGTVFTTMLVLAWTGPTSPPPSGNVAAPLNVSSTDQIKEAGLGLDALAVFGNAILSGASRYLNFGDSAGESGYGIRYNAGTMEFKNSTGNWSRFLPSSGVQSINFADGTTQTTAASESAGVTANTTSSCNRWYLHSQLPGRMLSKRVLWLCWLSMVTPSGANACRCEGKSDSTVCYA